MTFRAVRRPAVLSAWGRWNCLPLAVRLFASVSLTCCAAPPFAVFYARWLDANGETLVGRMGLHPLALALGCFFVVLVALVLVERPRVVSVLGYGAQLVERMRRIQALHDAALRRHTQE